MLLLFISFSLLTFHPIFHSHSLFLSSLYLLIQLLVGMTSSCTTFRDLMLSLPPLSRINLFFHVSVSSCEILTSIWFVEVTSIWFLEVLVIRFGFRRNQCFDLVHSLLFVFFEPKLGLLLGLPFAFSFSCSDTENCREVYDEQYR